MKRSEMLKLYEKEYPSDPMILAFVDQVLAFFEKHGMQPPPYTFKHKVVNPTTVNTISVTNYEWEDEE